MTNSATIGKSDTITADGVSVKAEMGETPASVPAVNDFSAGQAFGVAVGTDDSVAGSAAINVVTVATQASIGAPTNPARSADGVASTAAERRPCGRRRDLGHRLHPVQRRQSRRGRGRQRQRLTTRPASHPGRRGRHDAGQVRLVARSVIEPIPNSPAETIIATGNLDSKR